MAKQVIYRGSWYWRRQSRDWRDSNTGQKLKLPAYATLQDLKIASLRGKPKIEAEHSNLYGEDVAVKKDAVERKKIANDIILRRKERN